MSTVIHVKYLLGTYTGFRDKGREIPELWPDPVRIFCALVAAAGPDRTAEESVALMAVTRAGSPEVMVTNSTGYRSMLVNTTVSGGSPKAKGALKTVIPCDVAVSAVKHAKGTTEMYPIAVSELDTVSLIYKSDELDPYIETLRSIGSRVRWVGRSEDRALVTVTSDTSVHAPTHVPRRTGQHVLRVPGTDALDALDRHHVGARQLLASGYRLERYGASTSGSSVHCFRIDGAVSGVEDVARVVARVRHAMISYARSADLSTVFGDSTVAQWVGGHAREGADPGQRIRIVPVPAMARSSRARDRISHVALDVRTDDQRVLDLLDAVSSGLVGAGLRDPVHGETGEHMVPAPETELWPLYGIARTWRTVVPACVTARALKTLRQHDLVRDVVRAGYPEPDHVEPFRFGAAHWCPVWDQVFVPAHLERRADRGYARTHLTIKFREPVAGPVVVGPGRFYGLGLCVPGDRS